MIHMQKQEIIEQITQVLTRIEPMLQADGGGIEFVDYDDEQKVVKVRFLGACQGCPMAHLTLQNIVFSSLKEEMPFITDVIAEHA